MPRPSILIHNAATGETVTREMDDAELAQYEADQAASAAAKAAQESDDAAQATAKAALLKRLGITADEARLLLS